MAGAVNITIGAVVGPFVAGIRQAQSVTAGFTSAFKQQFDGLKASADAPKGAFAELTRNLAATQRQIKDVIAAGGQVPTDLTAKFKLLQGAVNATNSAFVETPSRLQSIASAGEKLQGIGQNLSTFLTLPILGAGAAAIKLAGDNEKAAVSFTVLLGDAKKASDVLKDLKQFSADTPFEFPEVQSAAKSLLAFGFSADQLKPALTSLGDIASGIDAPIGEIAEIYGKARTQGRLFGEDINQLTGRGIPIIAELAKQFNVTEGEVKKLVESGKVNFSNLETAFQNLTKEGGKFGGLMKAQSQTIPGLLSSLKDSAGQSLADIGTALANSLNLKEIIPALASGITRLSALFTSLGPSAQNLIFALAGTAAAAGPLLFGFGKLAALAPTIAAGFTAVKTAFSSITTIGPLLAGVSAPVLAIGAAVALTAGLVIFYWSDIKKYLTDTGFFAAVSEAVASAMALIRTAFTVVSAFIREKWAVIREAFSAGTSFITAIWERFGPILTGVASTVLNQLVAIFKGALGVISQIFQGFTALLKGDWAGFGQALVNVGIIFTNTLTGLIAGMVKGIIGLTAGLFDAFGADEVAAKIRGYADTVDKIAAKLKISLIGTAAEAKRTGAELAKLNAPTTATNPSVATKPKATASQKTPTLPKADKEAAESYKEATTALDFWRGMVERTRAQIVELQQTGKPVPAEYFTTLQTAITKTAELESLLDDLGKRQIIDIPVKVTFDSLGNIQKTALLAFQGQAEQLGGKAPQFATPTKQANGAPELPGLEAFKTRAAEYNKAYREFQDNLSQIPDFMQNLKDKLNTEFSSTTEAISAQAADMAERISGAVSVIKSVVGGVGASLLGSLGESLGAGNTNPLKSALKSILDMIAGYAIQIGTALLLSSAALLAAAPFTAGITLTPGIGQKFAGAGLILAGGVIKGLSAKAFANGGLVYGPTLGLVGEGIGTTRSNPEVIAPLDKLKDIIGNTGGGVVVMETSVRGEDIYWSQVRTAKRLGGI